jgi:hypothetical protein
LDGFHELASDVCLYYATGWELDMNLMNRRRRCSRNAASLFPLLKYGDSRWPLMQHDPQNLIQEKTPTKIFVNTIRATERQTKMENALCVDDVIHTQTISQTSAARQKSAAPM